MSMVEIDKDGVWVVFEPPRVRLPLEDYMRLARKSESVEELREWIYTWWDQQCKTKAAKSGR